MDDPKSILVIQLKRVGDVVLTLPLPAVLKRRFPNATIGFLAEKAFAPVLEQHPAIDRIHRYDKTRPTQNLKEIRNVRYDWVLDFQSSPRSALVALTSGARLTAGYRVPFWGFFYSRTVKRPADSVFVTEGKLSLVRSIVPDLPAAEHARLFLTEGEQAWAKTFDPRAGSPPVIGIVSTHRRSARRWPAESFAALGRTLVQKGYAVWLFWGPGEQDEVASLQRQVPESVMIPASSLRQMAALLARCRCVISNDNGPMHLAHAAGVPTVTMYGPTDPRSWNPGGPQDRVLQAEDVTCLRCNLNVCPFQHECMTHLAPERVFQTVEALVRPNQPQAVAR